MRVSKEAMAHHHEEILSSASRMLRQRGVEGLSVVELMKTVGLTHGGFYRHFASKEALVAEATMTTFDAIVAKLEDRTCRKGSKVALTAWVATYLSPRHVETPETGCPIAAYGIDIAREGPTVRAAFSDGVSHLLKWISGGLVCRVEDRQRRAVELLSMMVGAIVTARAMSDRRQALEFLHHVRGHAERLVKGR